MGKWTLTDQVLIILKSHGMDHNVMMTGPTGANAVEAARAVVTLVLDEAMTACKNQEAAFLSPKYAAGQPFSSIAERFACSSCPFAICAMMPEKPD